MLSTGSRWLSVGICVALAIFFSASYGLAWYAISLVGTAVFIAAMMLLKPVTRDDGKLNEATAFITCPNCNTKNPRHSHRIYECYNCGKSFSELSGRHPTLPSKVSGSNAQE